MKPVLSKMHQNSAKIVLGLKRPHKRHTYQTCHGGLPSQEAHGIGKFMFLSYD